LLYGDREVIDRQAKKGTQQKNAGQKSILGGSFSNGYSLIIKPTRVISRRSIAMIFAL
jgi:hypothetical protein